jgi:hypothetical protein
MLPLALLMGVTFLRAGSLPDDWAFRPLQRVTVPAAPAASMLQPFSASTNPIDLFIVARLAENKITPAPEADSRTLIRRLHFDLVGLPPTPEEVERFVQDRGPDAFERRVDNLLTSPHYGERWARHWLDVVRFGESQGFEYDRIRDHAWRYRDYVINAFNTDKPYNQFIREQLAGDVLEPVTREGMVATGLLVAGPWDQAGYASASQSVRAATREAEMEDMLGTIGQTFLGVTLNCARCHNHKFDPIPQVDYYRVKAVFQGVRHGERSILTNAEQKRRDTEIAQTKAGLLEVENRIAQLEAIARTRAATNVGRASRLPTSTPLGAEATPALPLARWTFETNAHDCVGSLHARLERGARISGGRLVLDGKEAFAITEPLKASLGEKTLEAWVALSTLEQGGGGVVSVEADDGQRFDAIVFGERQPRQWMAGSDSFRRTRDFEAPVETDPTVLIQVAIVYHSDRSIAVYRNGQPYGPAYQLAEADSAFVNFPAGSSRVLFGKRHTGGGRAMFSGEIEEARLYDRALSADDIAGSFRAGPEAAILNRDDLLAVLTDAERQQRESLIVERDRMLAASKQQPPAPIGYVAQPEKPDLTFVLLRGEPDKKREQVVPGALSAVTTELSDLGLAADAPEADRRRRFADWVASPVNPLTARVIVNRVWHYHFGRGLVATPNDFGKMGERPSHPELLDWLAAWFVAPEGANWSLKKLHRLILTSATWRQSFVAADVRSLKPSPDKKERDQSLLTSSARADADNRLLWRFTPRRLEVEAVRDAMLALSGELNPAMAGPGFRPFVAKGNGSQNEYFASDPIGPEFNRRTVYRICVHSARDPLLDSLDCPEFSTRTPSRPNTTTPLQALSLMNNSFVQRQAAKLAERVEREAGPDEKAQVRSLWLRCYAREPRAEERRNATKLAREQGLVSIAWVLLNSSEFVFVR